jgi:nicotinate-nucleotide--dimethylbenzimidazole phosphoribosyltransferase
MKETISRITAVDKKVGKDVQHRLDNLTKPIGSLGKLEQLAVQLGEITGATYPVVSPPASLVFAADHGIAAEGVSAYPSEVTAQMVYNFLNGGAAINVLAKKSGASFTLVDIGVNADLEGTGFINQKIRYGTGNFLKEKAMSREETEAAIKVGINVAEQMIEKGARSLILGEMGIGNTTASSALLACITDKEVSEIVGRGTGVSDDILRHKEAVIKQALLLHKPNRHDAIDILTKVGGLEIAGMAGAMLGGAAHRVPILVDGFISTVAANVAVMLAPNVKDYLIFGHLSQEQGHRVALERLAGSPLLDLNLRLGEGTGAALAFSLVEASVAILTEMASFEEANVSKEKKES